MAPKYKYTAEERAVLRATKNSRHDYNHDIATVYLTSGQNNDCLIHGLFGTVINNQSYAPEHEQIRKFLYEVVRSFTKTELEILEESNNSLYKALISVGTDSAIHFLTYRDQHCADNQMTRFLHRADITLFASLMNAYIVCWNQSTDQAKLTSHTISVFDPNPELRDLLMDQATKFKISVPKTLTEAQNKPFRAIHIENSNNNHFQRVKWAAGTHILFPAIHAATTMLNRKFNRTEEPDDLVQPQITKPVPPGSGGSSSGSATQKPLTFVTRAAANLSDPTHYHVKGLGAIKDIVEWVNHKLIKQNHKFKSGETEYRLFLKQDPNNTDRYQMFKCEVDMDGNYKKGAKAKPITPHEEKGWAPGIETLFQAYAKHKNQNPIFTGFNPRNQV